MIHEMFRSSPLHILLSVSLLRSEFETIVLVYTVGEIIVLYYILICRFVAGTLGDVLFLTERLQVSSESRLLFNFVRECIISFPTILSVQK